MFKVHNIKFTFDKLNHKIGTLNVFDQKNEVKQAKLERKSERKMTFEDEIREHPKESMK